MLQEYKLKRIFEDFPDGLAVKNLPVNAGDMGSIPGLEIPHAVGQLSPWATTTDPQALEPMLRYREATAMRSPSTAARMQPPLTTTRKSLLEATETQCRQR